MCRPCSKERGGSYRGRKRSLCPRCERRSFSVRFTVFNRLPLTLAPSSPFRYTQAQSHVAQHRCIEADGPPSVPKRCHVEHSVEHCSTYDCIRGAAITDSGALVFSSFESSYLQPSRHPWMPAAGSSRRRQGRPRIVLVRMQVPHHQHESTCHMSTFTNIPTSNLALRSTLLVIVGAGSCSLVVIARTNASRQIPCRRGPKQHTARRAEGATHGPEVCLVC